MSNPAGTASPESGFHVAAPLLVLLLLAQCPLTVQDGGQSPQSLSQGLVTPPRGWLHLGSPSWLCPHMGSARGRAEMPLKPCLAQGPWPETPDSLSLL